MKNTTSDRDDHSRISLAAHYTGYVWKKNKLADISLATSRGWWLYQLGRPLNFIAAQASGGANLETLLIQRHRIINDLLTTEIEAGRIGQVIELASGLSPRGSVFMNRFGKSHNLIYIESDLPGLIKIKRERHERIAGTPSKNHHFLPIDAFRDGTPDSLDQATKGITDPSRGCAVITEGLLSYFDTTQIVGLWGRIGKFLSGFSHGLYLSDLHIAADHPDSVFARLIRKGIETSVRGRIHLLFENVGAVDKALHESGFSKVLLHRPADFRPRLDLPAAGAKELLRMIQATTGN